MPRPQLVTLFTLLLLTLGGCSSPPSDDPTGDGSPTAEGLAYTHTYEVRFADEGPPAGFMVEFLEVPLGLIDERMYPPGSILLQDPTLRTLGFVTPANHGWTFLPDGSSRDLGRGGRDTLVAVLLDHPGERPRYTRVTGGL